MDDQTSTFGGQITEALKKAGFQTYEQMLRAFVYEQVVSGFPRDKAYGTTLKWIENSEHRAELLWALLHDCAPREFARLYNEQKEIRDTKLRKAERKKAKKQQVNVTPYTGGNGSAVSTGDQVRLENHLTHESSADRRPPEVQPAELPELITTFAVLKNADERIWRKKIFGKELRQYTFGEARAAADDPKMKQDHLHTRFMQRLMDGRNYTPATKLLWDEIPSRDAAACWETAEKDVAQWYLMTA